MDILDESLVITHRMMLDGKVDKERWQRNMRVEMFAHIDSEAAEVPLPQVDIYSYVIGFQRVSFATGSVTKTKR